MLIVLGHLEPGTYLMRFLYSFHIFIFFALSGFVGSRYEDRPFRQIIKDNLRRLFIPYLFWSVLSNGIDFSLGCISISQAGKNILFLNANVGWNAALWFLLALFWADTLCAFIVKTVNNTVVILGVTGCFLFVWYIFAHFKYVFPFGLYTLPAA